MLPQNNVCLEFQCDWVSSNSIENKESGVYCWYILVLYESILCLLNLLIHLFHKCFFLSFSKFDITIEKHVKMLIYNLADIMHNKWLQELGVNMTCLYKHLIIAFMQITYYRSWLKGGPYGKGFDSIFLKLKDVAMCGDPKLLAKVMNTNDCVLENLKMFESTKKNFDLPHRANCDLHQPNKVNSSLPY